MAIARRLMEPVGFRLARGWRTTARQLPFCRASSSSTTTTAGAANTSTPSSADADAIPDWFTPLRASMLARPATSIFDSLSPTPSHLLNISLSDFLPPSCWPAHFTTLTAATEEKGEGVGDARGGEAPSLPQGHHLVYFAPQLPPSQLLSDGTDPAHSPGPPYARRMWAGGRVEFRAGWEDALRLDGRRAVCVESIGEVRLRGGGAAGAGAKVPAAGTSGGEKIFVDLVRRYGAVKVGRNEDEGGGRRDADAAAVVAIQRQPQIEEVRTLVFMRERAPGEEQGVVNERRAPSRLVKAPYEPTFSFSLRPSATLLFHYSALTFNAHAIHLDPQYCRQFEGHRNLLVHGPLSLTFMLSALRSQLGPGETIKTIEYRNLAPLYAGEDMRVCLRPSVHAAASEGRDRKWDVWIEGPDGGLAVKAVASS